MYDINASRDGEHINVTINGAHTFPLTPPAATSLRDALTEALAESDGPQFTPGDRVHYDGSDNLVFHEAGEATVVGQGPRFADEDGGQQITVTFDGDEQRIVNESALSKVEALPGGFKVGDRVHYDGEDDDVFTTAGNGTVTATDTWFDGQYAEGSDEERSQYVKTEHLSPLDLAESLSDTISVLLDDEDEPEGTDLKDEQTRALRRELIGLRVRTIDFDGDGKVKVDMLDGERSDSVYAGPIGSEGAIVDFDTRGGSGWYDEDTCFTVQMDSGAVQTMAFDYVEPVDPEDLRERTLKVAAEFAERRGIVVGALVTPMVPSIEALLGGPAKVESVEGGLATVEFDRLGLTKQYPASLLVLAD